MLNQPPRGAAPREPCNTPPTPAATSVPLAATVAAGLPAHHRRQVSHFSRPDPRCYQPFLANGSPTPRESKTTPAPVGDATSIGYGHITPLATATTIINEPPYHVRCFSAYHQPTHQPVHEYSNGAWSNANSGYFHTDEHPVAAPAIPSRSRHRSIPNLQPLAITNWAISPERGHRLPTLSEAEMALTGDGRFARNDRNSDTPRNGARASRLSSGTTAAHDGDVATKATPNADAIPIRRTRPSTSAESQQKQASNSSPPASRFGFLSAISSALTTQTPTPAGTPGLHDKDDELLAMDVDAALFPGGPPVPGEAFSPSAFKNLQMNAAAVARRLHGAYRERTVEARGLAAEMEAQREELEEATLRSSHLKMQLEDMATKAAEQERAMRGLLEELAAERRKTAKILQSQRGDGHLQVPATSEGSISEDLGVDAAEEDQRRRRKLQRQWRGSGGTMNSFDTDDDESVAESESVFSSRCRSPSSAATADGVPPATTILSPTATLYQSPTILSPPPPHHGTRTPAGSRLTPQSSSRLTPQQQQPPPMTTFQRLIKNVTSGTAATEDAPVHSCSNCQGLDVSVAWDTVHLLKDENQALKERMNELEDAVEGALDLVNGIGL